MSLPKGKHPRLKQHDYSEPGAYFITVCTKNKAHILSRIVVDLPSSVRRDALIPPRVQLLPAGKIVDDLIRRTETVYDNVTVEAYVIMPNHLHILFHIHAPGNGGGMGASHTPIHQMVRAIKTGTTRHLGHSIFQTPYHDHVIRGPRDSDEIFQYIQNNPAQWPHDQFYTSDGEEHP